MAWITLVGAGLFEVVGAVALGLSAGLRRVRPTIVVFAAFAASLLLLSSAATEIAIGTAYAVWTGIGAAGTAIVGMLALGEPRGAKRLASLALVVGGAIGMKLFS